MDYKLAIDVYNRLVDETSRSIFNIYLKSQVANDLTLSIRRNLGDTVMLTDEKRQFMRSVHSKIAGAQSIAICGVKYAGYVVKYLGLFNTDFQVSIIDRLANQNQYFMGKPVKTYSDFFVTTENTETLFLIAPHIITTCQSIENELLSRGVSSDRVVCFSDYYNTYSEIAKRQYFDFYAPDDNEIFVDGGAYDGQSVQGFITWCGGDYKKIYVFEPGCEQFKITNDALRNYKNIEMHNSGLWNENKLLSFKVNSDWKDSAGFSVNNMNQDLQPAELELNKAVEVEATTLDSILQGEPVTFIKLDVEGAEQNAIIGMTDTIRRYAPKLAISVYHNSTDYIEIPAYFMQINPDYYFAYRHYSLDSLETVLYAFPLSAKRYQ